MQALGWILFFLLVAVLLAYKRAVLSVWTIAYFVLLLLVSVFSHVSLAGIIVLWVLFAIIFIPLNILPLRRQFLSKHIMGIYQKSMPSMSATEKEALTAGGVGWEGEMFTGIPDWKKLQELPEIKLTQEEQEFLAGPVEELCGLISNWDINHTWHEIPAPIWDHLKKHGFFGLIIPKQYGGKQFSALAHSQIITKVAGVSIAVGCVVSVPNSLGPAELLLEYGTEQQKNYYLPRLARGEEIPCFALTSPVAGSDASSIEDHGVVCKRMVDGKETLGIILNWNKRYITLSPIATLIGLAFKLYDPDHLLGNKESLGITCALIPVETPGVVTGRRHFPLCSHFPNGPTQGKDVFIPLEFIIGGPSMVGAGWRMLMECLAAGRSISLPSMSTGGSKRAIYATGAYARIRRQFNTYIGTFGGVQEALARIAGYTYLIEAVRLFSVTSIDRGIKSAVSSAITKYHVTEYGRRIVDDAMDIHGGKGICMGPHNYLAQSFIETPISITVEGANILTRSMIIFGQGAIRCHPYILTELNAVQSQDLVTFDKALFKHMGMIISNKTRAFCLGLTNGRGAGAPNNDLKHHYQRFSRFASAFAYLADVAMLTLGGKLKRKERLSARLGDMLSYLYMGSAVLKYYEIRSNREELTTVDWICQYLLFRLQEAMHEFLLNLPNRWLAVYLRFIVFPLGRWYDLPVDRLGKNIAALIMEPSSVRERVSEHLYTRNGKYPNPIADIQVALEKSIEVEPLLSRLHQAQRKNQIQGMTLDEKIKSAIAANILTPAEGEQLLEAEKLRLAVTNVDDFSLDEFRRTD